jgi:hypothetical protein
MYVSTEAEQKSQDVAALPLNFIFVMTSRQNYIEQVICHALELKEVDRYDGKYHRQCLFYKDFEVVVLVFGGHCCSFVVVLYRSSSVNVVVVVVGYILEFKISLS